MRRVRARVVRSADRGNDQRHHGGVQGRPARRQEQTRERAHVGWNVGQALTTDSVLVAPWVGCD